MSIRAKIILAFFSVAVAIGLLGGLAFYRNIKRAEPIARHEAVGIARAIALSAGHIMKRTGPLDTPATLKQLQDLIREFKLVQNRDVVIVNRDNVIIAAAVPEELGTRFIHDLHGEVGQTMEDGRTRTFSETSAAYPRGIKQLVLPFETENGMRIGAVILEYAPLYTEVLRGATDEAKRFLLFSLLVLVIALAAGYLVSRHISRPLHALQRAALTVAGGDLEQKLSPARNDELGSVAASFNIMIDELKKSRDRLVKSHQELAQEIGERIGAEKRLQEALERVQTEKSKTEAVIQGLGVGIIIQDLNYRILYENELQQRMAGNHIGELCYAAYEKKDELCEDCPMEFSLHDGGIHKTERRIPTPGGDLFYELVTSPLRDVTGTIIGGIKMVRDITERKQGDVELQGYRTRLEELVALRTQELSLVSDQLRQAQKMEAVGQLAGGIAHDFNNILSAIINCATILQMDLREDDPLTSYVDQILASSDRAANLTQSLLAFSRKQLIKPRPVELNDVIRRVELLLTRVIGEDVELRTRLTTQGLPVMADAGQIEQVLMNLATNARDAMPGGGQVIIHSGVSEIDDRFVRTHGYGTPGPYALMSITDTGIGIDEAILPKIFEPFFTTKEVGKGTGLGLSIVYGIVKQHHGYITVQSERDKGTAFTIYLPLLASATSICQWPKAHAAIPQGTETILLAEDESALRDSARRMLERFGYRVLEAKDGEEAVRIFTDRQDTIDLVVLDMVMPKMNGREVYGAIKKKRPAIKALFVSGYAVDGIFGGGSDEEPLDIIQKPLQPADFLKKVRQALDSPAGS